MRMFLLEQACARESALSTAGRSEAETTRSSRRGARERSPERPPRSKSPNGFDNSVKGLGLPGDFSNFSYLVQIFIRFLRRFPFFHCTLHT